MNILITGVSSGLGRYLAIDLLNKGNNVIGISRKEIDDNSLADFKRYNNFTYKKCDVSNEENIEQFFEDYKDILSNLDIVVLNAASMVNDIYNQEFDYNKFKQIFNINLFGYMSFVDKILPIFLMKNKGMFVAISSLAAYKSTMQNGIAYASSKVAINMAFDSLRLQFYNKNIKFIVFNPGRMQEKSGLLAIAFKKASQKIISVINKKKNIRKNVFDFPLLNYILTKILQILPEYVSAIIIKIYTKSK